MDQEKKNKFEELYRLIDITAKARYQAAKRLALHGYMTQWVLSFLAIGLIILSLLELLDFKLSFTATYTGFMQVVFAVIILTYSLLLGMGNFDARAERLHRCGLELSRLLRKVKPLKENEKPNMGSLSQKDENGYEQLVKDYYDCLEKYENHKDLDFRNALLKIQKRKGYPERNAEQPESGESKEIQKEKLIKYLLRILPNIYSRAELWLNVRTKAILEYSHYFISILLVFGWLVLAVI